MKKFLIGLFFISAIVGLLSCNKTSLLGNDPTGEGLVGFVLKTPTSGTSIVLNSATPSALVDFNWAASTPGLYTMPTYKLVAALRSNGDLNAPLFSISANNKGKDTKLSLSYKSIDSLLSTKGIAAGAKVDLVWGVMADNKSTQILSSSTFFISFTRFSDGASPFVLLGPVSSLTPVPIDPSSNSLNFKFNWTKSMSGVGSTAVTYKIDFALRKVDANGTELPTDFSTPLFSAMSNSMGADTLFTLSYKALSDSLNAKGLTDLSMVSALKWRVNAVSGKWSQVSDYINDLGVIREVRVYMPGGFQTATGNGADWTPANAPEMIRDLRPGALNNLYYIYIYLPANSEFKFTQGRSWNISYGGVSALVYNNTAVTGDVTDNNGANFKVTNAGVYRISFDRSKLKANISLGRMGFVGAAVTNVGWDPTAVFPTSAMANTGLNTFLGIYSLGTGGWKLIDNDQWNTGSKEVDETRSYGSTGTTSALDINGANMPDITASGRYRVIWDGNDVNNIKYSISDGNMYVIGDATVGGWENSAALDDTKRPPLNYIGNGKWQGTVSLTAGNIKFIVKKGSWDFNYGGANGKLSYYNAPNITIATAGTYMITVDEYAGTYSVQ